MYTLPPNTPLCIYVLGAVWSSSSFSNIWKVHGSSLVTTKMHDSHNILWQLAVYFPKLGDREQGTTTKETLCSVSKSFCLGRQTNNRFLKAALSTVCRWHSTITTYSNFQQASSRKQNTIFKTLLKSDAQYFSGGMTTCSCSNYFLKGSMAEYCLRQACAILAFTIILLLCSLCLPSFMPQRYTELK